MSTVDMEHRKEQISSLYLEVLNREPDEPGLNSYLFSDASIEDIKNSMESSSEFQELERKNNFNKQLGKLGTGELLLMGSSPRSEEHSEALRAAGVQALLSLDQNFERPYDHSWCENFLNVPLKNDYPISEDQVSKILDFLYTNVVIGGRKTFIHSNLGASRSPLVVCLFLIADKGLTLLQALNVVSSKQNMVNPDRSLLTGSLLSFVKGYKFKDLGKQKNRTAKAISVAGKAGTVEYVGINSNLFLGKKLTPKMIAEFRKGEVDVIVDLNETRKKLPPESQWFSHIHLPLSDDKMNEMMPVALRNVNKYTKRGRVYVMCDEVPKLMMFAENFASNSNDALIKDGMERVRAQVLSL